MISYRISSDSGTVIKFLSLDFFFGVSHSFLWKNKNAVYCLQISAFGTLSLKKSLKYANEMMTDDAIHSTQYYIKYRAISANFQQRQLKLAAVEKLFPYGNSFFSSLHPLDFKLKWFSARKTWNEAMNSSQHICMLAGSCIWGTISTSKWNAKAGQKSLYNGEAWNPVCCHSNETIKLVLWSNPTATNQTYLIQIACRDISFCIIFAQNLVEWMMSSLR